MSVGLRPDGVPSRLLPRPIEEIASSHRIDPRIPALVPGFDAPFFQAGLAGYSDGAMRLVARRHGCPFCVTEALLDRTLVNGGKGRRKEDPDLIACECGMGEIEDNQAALSALKTDDEKRPQLTLVNEAENDVQAPSGVEGSRISGPEDDQDVEIRTRQEKQKAGMQKVKVGLLG